MLGLEARLSLLFRHDPEARGPRCRDRAGAPRAKEAKHLPPEPSQGSGNLESSPTRNTRDLLLKVVPTAARVSLHLLLNPPRSPRPRPLARAAASYRSVFHTRAPARRHGPLSGSAEAGPRRSARPGFRSGPKGAGRGGPPSREPEPVVGNLAGAPRGGKLCSPGGIAGGSGPSPVLRGPLAVQADSGPGEPRNWGAMCSHAARSTASSCF